MPILISRSPGKAILDRDINQLIDAFTTEHIGTSTSNLHNKFIRLGLPDADDSRGLIANLASAEKTLEFDPTRNGWGQIVDSNGFELFLTERTGMLSDPDMDPVFYSNKGQSVSGVILSGLQDTRFSLSKPFFIMGGLSSPVRYVIGRRRTNDLGGSDEILVSGLLGIRDMATRIDRDDLGNMTLTDILAGSWKLSQLAQVGADRFFSPVFDDAVVYDVNSVLPTVGNTLSNSFDPIDFHNFYKWTSNQSLPQTLKIMLRVKLPVVFSGWANIRCYVKTTNTGGMSFLDVGLRGTNNVAATLTGATNLSSLGWTQYTILVNSGTFTAGQYITLEFSVTARGAQSVYLGEVELNYA